MSDKDTPSKDIDETKKSDSPKKGNDPVMQKEIGGFKGPEPTRYGDWEKNGIISDF